VTETLSLVNLAVGMDDEELGTRSAVIAAASAMESDYRCLLRCLCLILPRRRLAPRRVRGL